MDQLHIYHPETGRSGEEQLDRLDQLFGKGSRDFLNKIGLCSGMRILDVGCGIGNLSCWIAEQVGENGGVTALDINPDQIAIAKERAKNKGLTNISFVVQNADHLSNFKDQFDMVYCRSLLIHVSDPTLVVQNMAQAVNEMGILACEVTGNQTSTFFYPPYEDYNLLWKKLFELFEKSGDDIDICFNIFKICQSLKNFSFDFDLSQRVLTEHNDIKQYLDTMCILLESLSNSLINDDILSKEEITKLKNNLQSHFIAKDTLVFLLRTTQVWCRKNSLSAPLP